MRNIYLYLTLLASSSAALAQNKLDAASLMLLNDLRPTTEVSIGTQSTREVPQVTVLVRLTPGTAATDLDMPQGAVSTAQFGDVAVVTIPADALEELTKPEDVISISLSQEMQPLMNKARPASRVTQVQAGETLEQPYDGTGVVTGLMDTGIDPNHVNFAGTSDEESRVMQAYIFNNTNGIPTTSATTPGEVKIFTTDSKSESHGTHVAGIMAGSYKGTGTIVSGGAAVEGDVPYWGVAPGSEMVMCGGSLTEANILAGVEKVIAYAESQNKPAAVNLSVGLIIGPHDGSSNLSRGLAGLGKRGIICVATGNDGDRDCAVNLGPFTMLKSAFTTGVPTSKKSESNAMEFWSDDADGFNIDFVLYDALTKQTTTIVTLTPTDRGVIQVGGPGTKYPQNDAFTANFSEGSSFRMQGAVDANNNRYYVYVQSDLVLKDESFSLPGIKVYNKASKKGTIYGYTKNGAFSTYSVTGWKAPTANGSVSDMATGENIIAVGAYVSSANFRYLGSPGSSYTYSETEGAIASFSSYGPNVSTGNQLPVICTPGSAINSSVNSYQTSYTNNNSTALVAGGRNYRWSVMQGTSMACPYMTGAAALWLQADPSLTVDDVISIAKSTAIEDTYVKKGPATQWGAGKLNALEGIKEVIARKNAGIEGITIDNNDIILTSQARGTFEITLPGADNFTATLYDMQGIEMTTVTSTGQSATLDASSAANGIYLLSVQSRNSSPVSRKVVIR